jgi:hypothetical protein
MSDEQYRVTPDQWADIKRATEPIEMQPGIFV